MDAILAGRVLCRPAPRIWRAPGRAAMRGPCGWREHSRGDGLKTRLARFLSDDGLRVRAVRGTLLTVFEVAASNVLRLVSNMILTRLLFPEAFGLMALVQVFLTGLQMFSDVGIGSSIHYHARGGQPAFLNTAWTMQILRGIILWLGACALAWPAAWFYDEPMLAMLLPVAGLNAVVGGFATTKVPEASRELRLGRQTFFNLGWQMAGILISAFLAWMLGSVWALVFGGLIASAMQMVFMHLKMPGTPNRLCLDRESFREIFGFGRFVFLSTVMAYFVTNADKLMLGAVLGMGDLGIYNVGFFLGAAPLLMGSALNGKVITPLYRMKPPAASAANRRLVLRARRLVLLACLLPTFLLSWGGPWLVGHLYDPRYAAAGGVVSLVAMAVVPQMVFTAYGGVLLANGDSRRSFHLSAVSAVFQLVYMGLGIWLFGVVGAILAPALAWLSVYPLRARFARLYNAEDIAGDSLILALGLGVNGYACYLHWDQIAVWLG